MYTSRMIRRGVIALPAALLLTLGLVSCGSLYDGEQARQGSPEQSPAPSGVAPRPPINWERPFGGRGPVFAGPASANAVLPFEVRMPGFGQPNLIQAIPEDQVVPAEQVLALVFDFQEEGTVLLKEQLPGDMSIEVLKNIVRAHAGEPAASDDPSEDAEHINPMGQGPAPAFQMVALRGTEGLLVQSFGIGRVMWIEDGLLFDLTGESITPRQVLALAEQL